MPASHRSSTTGGIIKSISPEYLRKMAGSSQVPQEAPALTEVMVVALPLVTTLATTQGPCLEEQLLPAIRLSTLPRRSMVASSNHDTGTVLSVLGGIID